MPPPTQEDPSLLDQIQQVSETQPPVKRSEEISMHDLQSEKDSFR